MANRAPSHEDAEALSALTKHIVEAAVIAKYLAQRWDLPAIVDSLQSVGAPQHDSPPYGADAHQRQSTPKSHHTHHTHRAHPPALNSTSGAPLNGNDQSQWSSGQRHQVNRIAQSQLQRQLQLQQQLASEPYDRRHSAAGPHLGLSGQEGGISPHPRPSSVASVGGPQPPIVASRAAATEAAHVYDDQQQPQHPARHRSVEAASHQYERSSSKQRSSRAVPEPRLDRPYPVPPPPNTVDRDDEEMSVDEMILNSVDGQGGDMDNDNDDRDEDDEPSSPDFPRPRKRSHHNQNQAHPRHSTNQNQRYSSNSLSPVLQRNPHPPPQTSQPQNQSQWSTEEPGYQPQQQLHRQPQFVSDSRSSSAPHLGGNASNFAHYNATNKSRNNSNQHGQMRILSTHRAPQPLDGGTVTGSVGRASPSVMPISSANDGAPGAENQSGVASLYSNTEQPRRPAPIAPPNSRSPGSTVTVTTQHGSSIASPSSITSPVDSLNTPSSQYPPPQQQLNRYPSAPSLGAPITAPQAGFPPHLSRAPPHTLSQESFASSTTSTPARSTAARPGDRPHHPRRGAVPLAERLCSECGRPGRFKDGRSVEKWGPGPDGPGTVCDKCRKKMKRLDRKAVAPGTAALGSLQTNGSLLPPGSQDVASPITAPTERASPLSTNQPPSRYAQQIVQQRYNPTQNDYKHDRELDVLAEAADAMPSHPPYSQYSSSALPYTNRGPVDSSIHRQLQQGPDGDSDMLRTKQRPRHRVSPHSVSTVTAGSSGVADADGDPDADASVDGDEDLIAEWTGSASSRPPRDRDHERERERRRERVANGTAMHRGIPVSDVRSSNAPTPTRRSERSLTPVPPSHIALSGGAAYESQPHPAKRIKVEDGFGGGSDTGNPKMRKDKQRKRTPSFSPSPSPSPRLSYAHLPNVTAKAEDISPVMSKAIVNHTSSTVVSTSSERTNSDGTLPSASMFSDDGSTAVEQSLISGSASATSQSTAQSATTNDAQSVGNSYPASQGHHVAHPTKRPSLQAMDEDSPDADDFKSSTFPPTPTATLSSSILGKRPRRASIDDELLETATGQQELSGDDMFERTAIYDDRSRSSSRSRSRSSSPMRMQMKTSSLRVATGNRE